MNYIFVLILIAGVASGAFWAWLLYDMYMTMRHMKKLNRRMEMLIEELEKEHG